jgi:hypothetical protein
MSASFTCEQPGSGLPELNQPAAIIHLYYRILSLSWKLWRAIKNRPAANWLLRAAVTVCPTLRYVEAAMVYHL